MNAERRKKIAALVETISAARGELEEVRDAEQEAYDNLPESIQAGETGSTMEEAISNIEDVINSLEEAESTLGDMA